MCFYVTEYLNRTLPIRASHINKTLDKPTQFFLSWATRRSISMHTLSRWLTSVLKLAGIDTEQFTAHSYRGTGLSGAHNEGATNEQVITAGNWANTQTFNSFYYAPTTSSSVGKIILDHFAHVRSIFSTAVLFNFNSMFIMFILCLSTYLLIFCQLYLIPSLLLYCISGNARDMHTLPGYSPLQKNCSSMYWRCQILKSD